MAPTRTGGSGGEGFSSAGSVSLVRTRKSNSLKGDAVSSFISMTPSEKPSSGTSTIRAPFSNRNGNEAGAGPVYGEATPWAFTSSIDS